MSRDSNISGMRGNPACMARTWGAKVKGTSPRRSGRVECASTAGGLTVVPMLCEVAESFVSYFGSGVEQDDYEQKERCSLWVYNVETSFVQHLARLHSKFSSVKLKLTQKKETPHPLTFQKFFFWITFGRTEKEYLERESEFCPEVQFMSYSVG